MSTTIFQGFADAYMNSFTPTTPLGGATTVNVGFELTKGNNNFYRMWFHLDLRSATFVTSGSALPANAVVTAASLTFDCTRAIGLADSHRFYRNTQLGGVEGQLTWNKPYTGGPDWNGGIDSIDATVYDEFLTAMATGTKIINVLNTIYDAQMLRSGLWVVTTARASDGIPLASMYNTYSAKEAGSSSWPTLTVDWFVPHVGKLINNQNRIAGLYGGRLI